ncbi:hypothetical protein L226DRAFT_566977 [Lentinus tigrinus ALCF2SS1-7]|uniref:uncharacterized protein n=1 Tax=Lentinus tigrinus ALCF2SS1-7 TaxID=1328758 RepID=UPI001165E169|nr:hypothetical protein L226DRAFT_566977 [Lentinus tigrinus ALCF2SS1-7]
MSSVPSEYDTRTSITWPTQGKSSRGPIGREVLGAAQMIFMVFTSGSHVLTGLIAFNAITAGAPCSVVWAAATAIVCLVLTLPRTLNGQSYLSIASFASIMGAILITMVGVGAAGRQGSVKVGVQLPFAAAFLSVVDIVSDFNASPDSFRRKGHTSKHMASHTWTGWLT